MPGQDITLSDGTIVRSSDVMGQDSSVSRSIVLEVPHTKYLDSLFTKTEEPSPFGDHDIYCAKDIKIFFFVNTPIIFQVVCYVRKLLQICDNIYKLLKTIVNKIQFSKWTWSSLSSWRPKTCCMFSIFLH